MNNLTSAEQGRLQDLEKIIESGLQTFVDVGGALLEVRNSRLYKATHGTFEEYCRERWGMSKRHANRMIEAVRVADNLGPIGPIPATESQVRPLSPLPPEQQREAWAAATQQAEAEARPVTARDVADAANHLTRDIMAESSEGGDNEGSQDDCSCSGLDKTLSANTIQINKNGDTAKQFDTIQWCLKAVSRKHLLKLMRHLYIDKDFMSGCDGYRLHIALNDWALEPGLYEIMTIKANEILLAKSEDLYLEEYPSIWKAIPTQCKNGIPSFYCNMREFNNESYFVYHVYENTRHCYNIKHLEDICMEGILKIEMGEDYPKLVIASEDNDRLAILVPLWRYPYPSVTNKMGTHETFVDDSEELGKGDSREIIIEDECTPF